MTEKHNAIHSSQETPCSTKEKYIAFVHKHKTPIAIASLTIAGLTLGVLFARNTRHNPMKFSVPNSTTSIAPVKIHTNIPSSMCCENALRAPTASHPILVREHIRNLPNNQRPSMLKVAWAEQHGYSLGDNQTVVSAHIKTVA